MSTLTLPKNYGDLTLLFVQDFEDMWDELESMTNGGISYENVNSDFATWAQVELDQDEDFGFGATSSSIVRFFSDTNEFVFAHVTTARNTFFYSSPGVEIAKIDTDANFKVKNDIYFATTNTDYPLSWLIGYQKPIILYVNGTTIQVEQNTPTLHKTLIVFPVGPIAVEEDTSATHKFRMLETTATANGYESDDVGAADSGMRTGLSLSANNWYFVYAAVVRYGADAGNKFILVVDDTSPACANWSTLDTRYGAGCWVYLGCWRYGHGGAATTTMIPFQYDHQGWITFTGRAASNNFFGIRVYSSSVSATSWTSIATFNAANSGNAAPATCSAVKLTMRAVADGDGDICGALAVGFSTTSIMYYLPAFADNLTGTEAHGYEIKVPNNKGMQVLAKSSSAGDDWTLGLYISAVLDEFV